MNHLVLRGVIPMALLLAVLALASCGNDKRLVSITVSPQNITIGGVDCTTSPCQPTVQYTAFGFYNHGGKPKDITSQVVWTTNTPSILQFQSNPSGLLAPTGSGCGTNLGVTASVYSNPSSPTSGSIISGSAVVSVTCGR